jgi:transposase InsO family protein
LEELSINVAGPVDNKTKAKYFAVVVDQLTRFCWTFIFCQMPNATDLIQGIAEIQKTFTGYKTKGILSNCGGQCISSKWRDYWSSRFVTVRRELAYHPQSDGLTERKNQSLPNKLQILSANRKKWNNNMETATAPVDSLNTKPTKHFLKKNINHF